MTAAQVVEAETADPLLNLTQAGQILGGKCPQTVARWIKDGLLPCVRLPGGRLAVRASVARKFLGMSTFNGSS